MKKYKVIGNDFSDGDQEHYYPIGTIVELVRVVGADIYIVIDETELKQWVNPIYLEEVVE